MLKVSPIKSSTEFRKNLNERKQNGLITGTAIQRKLLGLIYTLWKNDTVYIDNYQEYRLSLSESTSGNKEAKVCFLQNKKNSEPKLTTQDRLRFKKSPKAFFLLLQS